MQNSLLAFLKNAITARIIDETIPIGSLELQIAYKLYLGTQKGIEDAVHLCTLFEESLRVSRFEEWVTRLDVERTARDDYILNNISGSAEIR